MSNYYDSRNAELQLQQAGLLVQAADCAVSFTGISNNSKETQEGDLFICKGFGFKPEYLQIAINRGAVCYVAEFTWSAAARTELPADHQGDRYNRHRHHLLYFL